MPRKGQAYPVTDTWRDRVERQLKKKKWSRADLARAVKVSPSVITELLNGEQKQSTLIPDIHLALELTPPQEALADEDRAEYEQVWEQLDEVGRARWLERGRALIEDKKKR